MLLSALKRTQKKQTLKGLNGSAKVNTTMLDRLTLLLKSKVKFNGRRKHFSCHGYKQLGNESIEALAAP